MRKELQDEIDRLLRLTERFGSPIACRPGATDEELAEAEHSVGIRLDDDLRDLYRFSNGGKYLETWFAAFARDLNAFWFYPLSEACRVHGWTTSPQCNDAANNGGVARDPRVQRLDRHTLWFPFADFANGNAILYFDADPTDQGSYGQIISWHYEPEAIRFCAPDLLTFVRTSNNLLELHGARIIQRW
jgi:cell wall assembly regulator SMI1